MPDIKLIVGLGNPGREYERTRHNIGFRIVDLLADELKASWKRWSPNCALARADDPGILIAKPQTYMNLSGRAVAEVLKFFKIAPAEMLVVFDDFALPFGEIRLRKTGSAGGHNGMKSIIEHLGTTEFPRLRYGIGPVTAGMDPADFVLSAFGGDEKEQVDELAKQAVEIIRDILTVGIDKALSRMKG